MRIHSQEQRLQFGRFGGGQGLRAERREQEESETLNGEPLSDIDLLRAEIVWGEEQLWWRLNGGGADNGVGERVREVEFDSYSSRENEMLLMEMVACEDEHWSWKNGWPQPGENEKGKGGLDLKGGHETLASLDGGGEQL